MEQLELLWGQELHWMHYWESDERHRYTSNIWADRCLGAPAPLQAINPGLREMRSRHDSLRTIFAADASPFQRTLSVAESAMRVVEVHPDSFPDAFRALQMRSFKITDEVPMAFVVSTIDGYVTRIGCVAHHVLVDGIGLESLMDELVAFVTGAAPIGVRPVQLRELVAEQREALSRLSLKYREHWDQVMRDLPNLTYSHVQGGLFSNALSGATTHLQELHSNSAGPKSAEIARRYGVPISAVWLAAFAVGVSRSAHVDRLGLLGTQSNRRRYNARAVASLATTTVLNLDLRGCNDLASVAPLCARALHASWKLGGGPLEAMKRSANAASRERGLAFFTGLNFDFRGAAIAPALQQEGFVRRGYQDLGKRHSHVTEMTFHVDHAGSTTQLALEANDAVLSKEALGALIEDIALLAQQSGWPSAPGRMRGDGGPMAWIGSRRGFVDLSVVAAALEQLPFVSRATVRTRNINGVKKVVAHVILRSRSSANDLRRYLQDCAIDGRGLLVPDEITVAYEEGERSQWNARHRTSQDAAMRTLLAQCHRVNSQFRGLPDEPYLDQGGALLSIPSIVQALRRLGYDRASEGLLATPISLRAAADRLGRPASAK